MKLNAVIQKIFRRVLRLVFRFDSWHMFILSDRPYAQDIIKYCNTRSKRDSILEIGCGLADILRHVDYKTKFGLDMDERALRAATFLSRFERGARTKYQVFRFPDSKLEEQVDVLIMVNWIFFFEEDTLRHYLEQYFHQNVNPGGAIIVDTLRDPHYPNHHDVKKLTTNLSCKIYKIGDYAREREVWSIEKSSIVA
jgi:cyclopropane fatty-acyl-phospholipid synthase-like methyltransferase